jgi:hypothetical protein
LYRGYQTDYNASGYPEKFSESCVSEAAAKSSPPEKGTPQRVRGGKKHVKGWNEIMLDTRFARK